MREDWVLRRFEVVLGFGGGATIIKCAARK
jgi:hypothetical protein